MRLYSEGLDFLGRGDPIAAGDRLERAAIVDPLNALSFSALSRASQELGYENQARSAAGRSVALSQGLTAAESLEVKWKASIAARLTIRKVRYRLFENCSHCFPARRPGRLSASLLVRDCRTARPGES